MHWGSSIMLAAMAGDAMASLDTSGGTSGPAYVGRRSAHGYPPDLQIPGASLSSKWLEGSDYVQILEFYVINNSKNNYLTLADGLNITIESDSLDLIQAGTLARLAPGQQSIVQVGVKNKPGVSNGSQCSGTLVATYGESYGPTLYANSSFSGTCGPATYTTDNLGYHWTPQWWDDAKFGIFIHWGLYSAPAWGGATPNENYAEWYWYRSHQQDFNPSYYDYHKETYGEDFNYDQFISNFTDAGWDPQQWVNLFANAGAKYFVPVTKHHDGFSLFNMPSSISKRNSVVWGPKRDFIGDLFAAAKQYQPHLKRGTYFSMPEWYNPAYAKYAACLAGCNDFGIPDTNPYTGANVTYTGYVPVDDFVLDIQLPQMKILANDYETDYMWCDIGGANNATIFASEWFNNATQQNRQVTINSRCGYGGDMSNPEYETGFSTNAGSWESNRGMDPYSFGFNYMTPDDAYMTGEDVVNSLVDIVSKNGNFLLDIGPTHNGSIPQIMQTGLLDAGKWLSTHGESIYETRFWWTTSGQNNFRYTTRPQYSPAFYIHYLTKPPSYLVVPDLVPYLPGDTVTLLGGSGAGTAINVDWLSNGSIALHIPDEAINGDEYVWTFKLDYTSKW
ncbi:alpha-L-fucosidase [Fusarium sp. NRRL 52700]|nr:alpha-L-fucosidase [Fusarium sp. NRRL 52700]